jgi:hypothetical protein
LGGAESGDLCGTVAAYLSTGNVIGPVISEPVGVLVFGKNEGPGKSVAFNGSLSFDSSCTETAGLSIFLSLADCLSVYKYEDFCF